LVPDGFFRSPGIPIPSDPNLLKLKVSLDNGILDYYHKEKDKTTMSPQINVTYMAYPTVPNRLSNGINMVGELGCFYLFLNPLSLFVILMTEIVKEKETRLR
jgi:hypothetical protein